MQQLYFDGPRVLVWREAAEPRIQQPTDALVRPLAVAVCDADAAAIRGKAEREPARPFGHEFVGEVICVGDEVIVPVGSRVVVSFKIACGECTRCLAGHSDAVRVPYANHMLFPLPAHVDICDAASAGGNLADACSCGGYRDDIVLPLGEMYRRGVDFRVGWVNTLAYTPKVIDLLAHRKLPMRAIHSVIPWSDAAEALVEPSHKTVVARTVAASADHTSRATTIG